MSEKELLLQAHTAVHKHGSIAAAAKALGIPASTLRGRYKKALKNDHLATDDTETKISKVKSDNEKIKGRNKELEKLLSDKDDQLRNVLQIGDLVRTAKIEKIKIVDDGSKSSATAVLVASDWHIEEHVDPKTVEGMNTFNIKVAEERASKFFQNGLKLIEMCRSKSKVDNLVLALIGDFITGYIHEELVESNELSPTQATLKAYELIVSGIEYLLKNGNFKQIIVPCCIGNHGRTTKKPRVSTAAQNSFEWMLFNFLEKKYKDHPVVKMKITDGYFNYLEVYGYTLRFHHGDSVQYQGGVGGLTIPLNKAIAQWQKFKKADIDILGHWHQRISGRDFVVNGSLIGFNAYAIKIKASYEPPVQTFFLVHPKYGKCVESPVWVE